jgi:hypothetical protein
MAEMSVQMVMRLVDQITGPAKGVETELEKLKRATTALNDIQKGAMRSSGFDDQLKVIAKRRQELEAQQQAERATTSVVLSSDKARATSSGSLRQARLADLAAVRSQERRDAEQAEAEDRAKTARAESRIAELKNKRMSAMAADRAERKRAAEEAAPRGHTSENHGIMSRHGLGGVALGAAAGYVGVHSVYHAGRETLIQGAEYQHERVALQNAGRTSAELAELEHAAREVVKTVPTASFTESLKALNETTSAFGSVEHAIDNLPFVMRTASVLKSAAGDKLTDDPGQMGYKLARFFEERGTAGNPEVFRKEADEMVKAMVFTRGNFNPSEMLNFAQQAKSSLQNYSLRFMSRIVPSIVTTMGGDRAGTAANAYSKVILGKVNDAKQAGSWEEYGLVDPGKAIKKNGKVVSWKPGAVNDTNAALTDPLKHMEEVILPALKAHGVNIDDRLELSKALNSLYRNPVAEMFAEELAQLANRQRLHKDEELMDKTKSPDQIYKNNLANDPSAGISALTASLQNLQTAVSAPAMKTAAGAISGIAEALQTLSGAASEHPKLALGAGVVAGGAALGSAGWMSYQIANGFGLPKAATELTAAAKALDGAAAKLEAGGGMRGPGGGLPGGPGGGSNIPGLGWRVPLMGLSIGSAVFNMPQTPEEFKRQAESNDRLKEGVESFLKKNLPAWLFPDKAAFEKGMEPTTAGGGGRGRPGEPFRIPHGEAPQANVEPQVDTSHLDDAKTKADSAKQSLELLNAKVTPSVDFTSIERLVALIAQANAGLSQLGARAAAAKSSFSPSSGALHDGPEAR